MKLLLLLSGGLQFTDGVLTNFFVRHGLVREGNPLMSPLVNDGSFLLIKIAGIIVFGFILWKMHRRFSRLALVTASLICLFYTTVIFWNLGVVIQ